jgi:5-oxoprolinase (ATP-hydrolysing)
MLGKLNPAHFPAVFGPNADQPLDADVVREKVRGAGRGDRRGDRSPEEVAEGFLRIAVENMANAIKKISVQRGYDVTRYALASFGGAGGQHACLVADALGMTTVIVHPFAGVLSAYGMGLADIRAMREVQFDAGLDRLEQAEQRLTELAGRRGPRSKPGHRREGASGRSPRASALRRLPPGACGALRRRRDMLRAGSRPRTGRASASSLARRDLVFDMLEVEAIGATEARRPPRPAYGACRPRTCPVHGRGGAGTFRSTPRRPAPGNGNRGPRHRQ